MKANELRIGNYLQGDPISIPKLDMYGDGVFTITGQGIAFFEQGLYNGHCNPIPLTEEWLLKFGAKKCNPNLLWIPLTNLKSEIHFELFDNEIVITLFGTYCELILDPIKYVHQLQNLYFALTGEELKIK